MSTRLGVYLIDVSPSMEAVTDNQVSPQIAYVFPGQGSQFVGMGLDIYRSSKAAKEVFDEVDDILSFPLTTLAFEGPEDELERTVNSQPAIMATSLACLRALNELSPEAMSTPVAVAGHSLGEYTSLVVSGALGLADGIQLVRERGRLMQEAAENHPGSMAAIIGLDEDTIEEICHETGAEIANINGNDQIVISGDRMCIARAADMASIRGAKKAIPLAVSGAFHSSLMSSAQQGLEEAMHEISFSDPDIPIFANSTSRPVTTAGEVKNELLTQLCSCVQWKKSVTHMIDAGVSSFIEFGPGKVLGSLIKRICASPVYWDKRLEVMNVADLASAMKVAESETGRALSGRPISAF